MLGDRSGAQLVHNDIPPIGFGIGTRLFSPSDHACGNERQRQTIRIARPASTARSETRPGTEHVPVRKWQAVRDYTVHSFRWYVCVAHRPRWHHRAPPEGCRHGHIYRFEHRSASHQCQSAIHAARVTVASHDNRVRRGHCEWRRQRRRSETARRASPGCDRRGWQQFGD